MYKLRSNEIPYIACVCLSFFTEGGHFSMFPTLTVEIFGLKNGGMLYTLMFFAAPVASYLGSLFVNYIQDIETIF